MVDGESTAEVSKGVEEVTLTERVDAIEEKAGGLAKEAFESQTIPWGEAGALQGQAVEVAGQMLKESSRTSKIDWGLIKRLMPFLPTWGVELTKEEKQAFREKTKEELEAELETK